MGGAVRAEQGETITEAKMSLNKLANPEKTAQFNESLVERKFLTRPADVGHYFRVEVFDGDEGYAWSNPMSLDEVKACRHED